ncbi:hypothetical protein QQ045_016118 [Rhodiola kirilowii]
MWNNYIPLCSARKQCEEAVRLAREKQNEHRSPIKFMTSAEAIRVSDSESSSDENDRKRPRHAEKSDTDDDMNSGSDGDNVDSDGDMEDDDGTDANDELIIPVGKKQGGSILFRNMRTRSTCNILRSAIARFNKQTTLH